MDDPTLYIFIGIVITIISYFSFIIYERKNIDSVGDLIIALLGCIALFLLCWVVTFPALILIIIGKLITKAKL